MKRQYLGDAKDSFKWDYHDHLTRELGYPTLNIVLMMNDDDGTTQGCSPPERYPANNGVLALCRELRGKRKNRCCPALIDQLPMKTNSSYSVEFHNDCHKRSHPFSISNRREYFDGFRGDKDQVVLVDPDIGFEPLKSSYDERHVRFREINRIAEQISGISAVSVFQFSRRGQKKGEFKERYEYIRKQLRGFTTAIYWDVHVMFVLLCQSKDQIQKIHEINQCYRQQILSRRTDFADKLLTVM